MVATGSGLETLDLASIGKFQTDTKIRAVGEASLRIAAGVYSVCSVYIYIYLNYHPYHFHHYFCKHAGTYCYYY